jgi:hypothetical protein
MRTLLTRRLRNESLFALKRHEWHSVSVDGGSG